MVPESTSEAGPISRGRDSPVRGGVHRAVAAEYCPVQGEPFTGEHCDARIRHHRLRRKQLLAALRHHPHMVGLHGQQSLDGAAALLHRHPLEHLAHLVKQHDGGRFRRLPDAQGPHGGNGHEEVLVQHPPPQQVPQRVPQHVIAGGAIGSQVETQLQAAVRWSQQGGAERQEGNPQPDLKKGQGPGFRDGLPITPQQLDAGLDGINQRPGPIDGLGQGVRGGALHQQGAGGEVQGEAGVGVQAGQRLLDFSAQWAQPRPPRV